MKKSRTENRTRTTGVAAALLLSALAGGAAAEQHDDGFGRGMFAYETRDFATALLQFSAAATSGDSDAQYMLGRLYAGGLGVPQNFIEAYRWYNLAAAAGQRLAAPARDALAMRMSADQIAAAQQSPAVNRGASATGPVDAAGPAGDDGQTEPDDSSETTIAQIQLQLKRLGYPLTAISGRLDDDTRQAIERYQQDRQLAVTGQPSRRLLDRMANEQQTQTGIRRATPTDVDAAPADGDTPADTGTGTGTGTGTAWRKLL